MGVNRGIGKPRIKKNYSSSIGDVKNNIQRKIRRSVVKNPKRAGGVKSFGFSFK